MQRFSHGTRAGIRTKVLPLSPLCPTVQTDSRVSILAREKNIGVGFIVPQQDVVRRLVVFDEVVLQQQGIHLGRGYSHLYFLDARHQRHGFFGKSAGPEIAANPVLKIAGLTDIEQFVAGIIHLVDTRPGGQ